jgi:hypothetical protein
VALTDEVAKAPRARRPSRFTALGLLQWLALLAGTAAALPLIGVVFAALSGPAAEIPLRDVLRYAATSAWLAMLVGLLTAAAASARASRIAD